MEGLGKRLNVCTHPNREEKEPYANEITKAVPGNRNMLA